MHNAYETLAISVPTVVDAARGRLTKQACDERLRSWASKIVEHNAMHVEVHGRENFDPSQTYLVMSNHQSHYDVPVLFYVLGGTLRMVAKIELFTFPFFGRAMLEAGFIAIDRKSRDKAMESLREAKERMNNGVNVWIAPEGTRSPDGRLLPFKKGGFHLALDVGVPVLPVTVQGTRQALPRGASRSRRGAHVRVTIHPAIDLTPYQNPNGVDALMADVRARIESAL
jgi:1-acyl-sn-glycerol-3-phosphate acyltransferase